MRTVSQNIHRKDKTLKQEYLAIAYIYLNCHIRSFFYFNVVRTNFYGTISMNILCTVRLLKWSTNFENNFTTRTNEEFLYQMHLKTIDHAKHNNLESQYNYI